MKVKLGDICTVVSDSTPKSECQEYWNGDINWVTPTEMTEELDVIYESQRNITKKAVVDSNLKAFPPGTVLLSSRAPIGKVAIAGKEMYCNQGFKNLICSEKIYNRYLFHFLKSKTAYLNSLGRGATFKEISKDIVENIEIPLPPRGEQEKIPAVLDKVRNLIGKHRQQLNKLDELVKSRFIEMFGDPETNPQRWQETKLKSLILKGNNGLSRRGCDSNGDIVLRLVELQKNFIDYSQPNRITLSPEEKERYALQDHDFLFARVNGNPDNVGRGAEFSALSEPVYFNDHIIRVHFRDDLLDSCFFGYLVNSDYGRKKLRAQIKTSAGQYTISQQGISEFPLYLPPLNLQKSFRHMVERIDKSKLAIQKSIDELEILKKKLMQEYFG